MEALLIFLKPVSAALCGVLLGAYITNRRKKKKAEKLEAEQNTKKDPVKISNSEADFQRWKAERESREP